MSLLTEQMGMCVMLDKTTTPDGYGGYVSKYVDGAPFTAAITFDTSMEAMCPFRIESIAASMFSASTPALDRISLTFAFVSAIIIVPFFQRSSLAFTIL